MHAMRKKKKTRTAENMERQATLVALHTRWHDDLPADIVLMQKFQK